MKTLIQTASIATLLLAACATTSSAPRRIDDALLSELTPESMATVVEARASKSSAEDALAKAARDSKWAEEQVELTRSNLKVVRSELDDSKLAMVTAEKSGTITQLEEAKRGFELASARADEVRDRLALRKREFEHAKLAQKVALEESRYKTAEVELRKAEAVAELDRVAARQVPVQDYRKQLRYHETEVQLAHVRLSAMAGELEDARKTHQIQLDRIDSLRQGQ